MKPPSIKCLLFAPACLAPLLQAQDPSARILEIEQNVLLKQRQEAIQSVIGAARDASASPDLIDKRGQWLTLVNNRIEGDGKSPAQLQEMAESARTINDLAWRMISPPDAAARNPEVALKLVTIALELGEGNRDLKPDLLDTKARALFLLGNPREAIAQQEKAIAAALLPEQKTALQATLDSYRKNELPEIAPPVVEADEPSGGVAYITSKLRCIVIPSVKFDDMSLEEAVAILREQSIALDATEPDPARKGVNFVVMRMAASSPTASGESPPESGTGSDRPRIKELHLSNVPLFEVLKYICEATRCRFKVDDHSVTFVPAGMPEDFFSRTFRVPPDFVARLNPATGDGSERPPLIEWLKAAGVRFGDGSSATLAAPDVLMMHNTPTELDKIEQLIEAMNPGQQ